MNLIERKEESIRLIRYLKNSLIFFYIYIKKNIKIMKYIKRFNEAVIKPYNFDEALETLKNNNDFTVDSINQLFEPYGVEFVDVDFLKHR